MRTNKKELSEPISSTYYEQEQKIFINEKCRNKGSHLVNADVAMLFTTTTGECEAFALPFV